MPEIPCIQIPSKKTIYRSVPNKTLQLIPVLCQKLHASTFPIPLSTDKEETKAVPADLLYCFLYVFSFLSLRKEVKQWTPRPNQQQSTPNTIRRRVVLASSNPLTIIYGSAEVILPTTTRCRLSADLLSFIWVLHTGEQCKGQKWHNRLDYVCLLLFRSKNMHFLSLSQSANTFQTVNAERKPPKNYIILLYIFLILKIIEVK